MVFYVPKLTFTLFPEYVQLEAPGHNLGYPVTPAEHDEAETFMSGFSEG